jgi:hypothetical protein
MHGSSWLAGVAVIAAATGLGTWQHAAAASPNRAHDARILAFIDREEPGNLTVEHLGSAGSGGVGLGDVIAFTHDLIRDGKKIGEIHLAGTGTTTGDPLTEANATLVLPDGSIQVAGVVPEQPRFVLAVVGGTGDFAGSTGTFDFDASGNAPTITVHLERGSRS